MAFQTNSSDQEQSTLSEINIIPLVDIMLVLLIIFMVAAPLLQESIEVDLPEVTTASSNTEQKQNILTINQQGQVFIQGDDKTAYDLETLGPQLGRMFSGDELQEKTIYLRADKAVPYGTVVKIMSLCREAGISRIGMVTEPENES